jgi:hypothetical protein
MSLDEETLARGPLRVVFALELWPAGFLDLFRFYPSGHARLSLSLRFCIQRVYLQ